MSGMISHLGYTILLVARKNTSTSSGPYNEDIFFYVPSLSFAASKEIVCMLR